MMPSELTVTFKRPVAGLRGNDKLRFPALGARFEALDEIAWEIGARPISKMLEGYANDDPDPWFCAKTGTMAITALLSYLQNNPDSIDDLELVMDELRSVKKPLSQAAEDLIPFRFIMS